jgi:hypothetical protein
MREKGRDRSGGEGWGEVRREGKGRGGKMIRERRSESQHNTAIGVN